MMTCARFYEVHQKKLKDIKNQLERKKVKKRELIDEVMMERQQRVNNNKLKSTEFKETGNIINL